MNGSDSEVLDPQTASALFANMVLQQTNVALMFLGKTPNPETGETMQELQAAKLLIDQLEMLAMKTKGNLDADESRLINDSLAALRMAFVEAVAQGPKMASEAAPPREEKPVPAPEAGAARATPPSAEGAAEAESRKKFTKKY